LFVGQVLKALQNSPEAQREAVLLVHVECLSYSGAADFLGKPIGTVRSRLAVARLALAKLRLPPRHPAASAPRGQLK
jgi:RNA polymerase sigma-70 factor, ECF subfamily